MSILTVANYMILTYSECVFFLIYSHGKKYTKSMVENKISKNRSICEDGVNLAECASDVPIFLTLKVFACGVDFLACPWHILLAYSLRDTLNYLYHNRGIVLCNIISLSNVIMKHIR